jgi:Xaa-Pro dipeptidase
MVRVTAQEDAEPRRSRVAALQRLLAGTDIDAVVISNPQSFRYFTNHLPLLSMSPTRAWYLVVPRTGEAVACVPSIGRDDLLTESWIQEHRTWKSPSPVDEGRSVLASTINEFGATKVAVEQGLEMRAAMSLGDYDGLRTALTHVTFVDAAHLIWSLRSIKDESEMSSMRAVIAAVQCAFAEVPSWLRPGMTEKQAARRFTVDVMTHGADAVPYLACGSGPGGYPSLTRTASDRVLENGDVIGFDLGATVDGYWCDFDRNFCIGTPPPPARRALDALEAAISSARLIYRPGGSVGELRRQMESAVRDAGFSTVAGGRWGHGVGLDFTEPPSVNEHDDGVLRPGMVVTLEPLIIGHLPDTPLGLVAEEMLLVTEDGHELLTGQPT